MANCNVVAKRINHMIECCHSRLIDKFKELHMENELYVETKRFLWGKPKPYKYTTSSQRKVMVRLDNGCWIHRGHFMHWWLDQRKESLEDTIAVVDIKDYDRLTEESLNQIICGMEKIAKHEGYSAVDMWNIYDPHIGISSMDLHEGLLDNFDHITGRSVDWEDEYEC